MRTCLHRRWHVFPTKKSALRVESQAGREPDNRKIDNPSVYMPVVYSNLSSDEQ